MMVCAHTPETGDGPGTLGYAGCRSCRRSTRRGAPRMPCGRIR